jgi:tetratricopeptide (TPR) repeat protein
MKNRLILVGLLLALFVSAVHADADNDPLLGEHRLVLQDGREFAGLCLGADRQRVRFEVTSGAGSAELTFRVDQVRRLVLPGQEWVEETLALLEQGETELAYERLQRIAQVRGRFLPVLSTYDREVLLAYAEVALERDDLFEAVATAQRLDYFWQEQPEQQQRTTDVIVLGLYKLGLKDQTIELASKLTGQATLFSPSAAGWYVLGELAFAQGDFRAALHQALRPIVFTSPFPTAHLDRAYGLAIRAALALERPELATQLYRDMQRQRLAWPNDQPFPALLDSENTQPKAI